MLKKIRVLLSAYACEPNKGSEPAAGWHWAIELSKWCDVTVLTRENNRAAIESALARIETPSPRFIYYDLPRWILALKRLGLSVSIYYVLWQLGARWRMRNRLESFDVIHHVTFNSFRWSGFWWHCTPSLLLGPLGGGQICPWPFLRLFGWRMPLELIRSLIISASILNPLHRWNVRAAKHLIIANADTEARVARKYRGKITRMLDAGIDASSVPAQTQAADGSGKKIIWVGRLEKRKACLLAIRALALARESDSELQLTVIGDGPERGRLERLTDALNLRDNVRFAGAAPHATVQRCFQQHDIFLFTSLRDTSGYVLLEAMAAGLPVITLLHQGAREMTTDETAIRIRLTNPAEVIQQLSRAMLQLSSMREMRHSLGSAGYRRVCEHYVWPRKAAIMKTIYEATIQSSTLEDSPAIRGLP